MGFHKRWINEDIIMGLYRNGGINSVKSYFTADALIIEDSFSDLVYNLLIKDDDRSLTKLLKENETI
jgi:hypothetical protein